MSTIFEKTELPHMSIKNRLFRSATWENLVSRDGTLPEELLAIYEELAVGGVGAIITGGTEVSPESRIFQGNMSLSKDEYIPVYQELTRRVHRHDCAILAQLLNSDFIRMRSVGALRAAEIDELTEYEIQNLILWFSQAAARADKAGFDGVQIHAAHGFFVSRFISPRYNHRKDAYGGSTENRARLLIEILGAIRQIAPNLHISVKVNFHDFEPNGIIPEEAIEICRLLEQQGIDSIEVSANSASRTKVVAGKSEAYFLEFSKVAKASLTTPIILVGGHRSFSNMEQILKDGNADYFSLARPLIREPNLPNRWQEDTRYTSACISCNQCFNTAGNRCVFVK